MTHAELIAELALAVQTTTPEVLALKARADAAYEAYDKKRGEYLELQRQLRDAVSKSALIGGDWVIAKTKGLEVQS